MSYMDLLHLCLMKIYPQNFIFGRLCLLASFPFMLSTTGAADIDLFGTRDAIATSASNNMLTSGEGQTPCQNSSIFVPLGLATAAELALCNNPQTRQAWANVKAQAARVGIAHSA